MIRRCLASFGLLETDVASEAASRVVSAVLSEPTAAPDPISERRALSLARRWIESFSRRTQGPGPDWFFAIPGLLRRFPRAFVESSLPPLAELDRETNLELLPAEAPCQMRTQELAAPLAALPNALDVRASHKTQARADEMSPLRQQLPE
jgi:hypothetical protein